MEEKGNKLTVEETARLIGALANNAHVRVGRDTKTIKSILRYEGADFDFPEEYAKEYSEIIEKYRADLDKLLVKIARENFSKDMFS